MNKISFPHIGSYYVVFNYLLKKLTKQEVIIPKKITKETINLGSKYSPSLVCSPFKYNLGNFIESLNNGANILVQSGGGCRYGYYAPLQEQILKDQGYEFEFVNLMKNNHLSLIKVYKFAKKYNNKINYLNFIYYLFNAFLMILLLDKFENYLRLNMAFEKEKGTFKKIHDTYLKELLKPINTYKILKINIKYYKILKKIDIEKPKNYLKVGLIGELFSLMEPYSSSFIEQKLIDKKISVYRKTCLTYLLLTKKFTLHNHIRKCKKYIKYHLGADGTESVYLTKKLSKEKYDGIVHIKSFGCTPEINAISIMNKISIDEEIPIIYFSFDEQYNETGLDTRLEAFYDMLINKKHQQH